MAHQNVFRTREGGGAKPLVPLSPQTKLVQYRVRYYGTKTSTVLVRYPYQLE